MSQEMKIESEKSRDVTIAGTSIPVYIGSDGEYRWSMRQVSQALGFNEGWLNYTLSAGDNTLTRLKDYGFKGKISKLRGQDLTEVDLISTEDFMAMIIYAAVMGMRRQAFALLAALHGTLERRADYAFGINRDEDEYIQLGNQAGASDLTDTVQFSMLDARADILSLASVSDLSDEQVVALTELQMEPDQDARLSELLDRQQANILVENERLELQTLMQIYQERLLRKATALSEAVKRRLIKSLNCESNS